MKEVYVSIDIESDGPIPGRNSMLSLGAAAFSENGTLLESWSRNLYPLPAASPDPETLAWWKSKPEAWAEVQKCRMNAADVMREFNDWLLGIPGRPVAVGYPATFDFMFVYWYLMAFVGRSPFGFQAIDIKTLAMEKLSLPFKETTKARMPREWFKGCGGHTHKAVEDAIEQGRLFFNIRNWKSDRGGKG